jgi:hypothetical protein
MFGQDELIYRANAVRQAWTRACALYMEKSIVEHTTADFYQLAGSLITGMLPILGIAVVGPYGAAVAGTLIGAFFGPGGAAVGADAGFLAGRLLVNVALAYMGVKFLLEYILPRIGLCGSHLCSGIQLGWDAGGWGDVARARFIDMAAQHFAEGVGVFFGLLLQALVLRLLKTPTQRTMEFANSLLYRSCPRLFSYLIANLETLRVRQQGVAPPPPVIAPGSTPGGRYTGLPMPRPPLPPAPPPPFYDFPEFRYRTYDEIAAWLKANHFEPVKPEKLTANGKIDNQGGSEIWIRERLPGQVEAVRIDRFGHETAPAMRKGPIAMTQDAATGKWDSERSAWGGVGHLHKESFLKWQLPKYLTNYVPEARTYSDNNTALDKPPGKDAMPWTPPSSPYYWQQAHIPIRMAP